MAHRLDLPTVLRCSAPRYWHEVVWKSLGVGHEGMISGHANGRRDTLKDPVPVVSDGPSLPMHGAARPHGAAPERLSEALMPEAYAEHRHASPAESLKDLDADSRLPRRAWTRRHHDARGRHAFNLVERALVVAHHNRVRTQRPEVLNEVEGEGVPVVEQEDQGGGRLGTALEAELG